MKSYQTPPHPVLIEGWMEDEDFAIHPKGSQPKKTLTCPDSVKEAFLIPGHSYLFKTAKKEWQQQQLWSEIIAYRLGDLIGLEVPACFAAFDARTGETGVLIEFFFGYPGDSNPPRLAHGGDLLTRVIADKKRGRPHTVKRNVQLSSLLDVDGATEWWAQAIVFDALISNVDRHPDNWGVLFQFASSTVASTRMAPLFDNATSLGYGLTDDRIASYLASSSVAHFCSKGKHHCGWDASTDGPMSFAELCGRFLSAYPDSIAGMRNVLRFSMKQFEEILADLTKFDVGIPFSNARASFVQSLVQIRRAELAKIVGLDDAELD